MKVTVITPLTTGVIKYLVWYQQMSLMNMRDEMFTYYEFLFTGSRGCSTQLGCRTHGRRRLPELHEDKHVQLGEDPKAQLQEKEVPHKTSSGRLCKLVGYRAAALLETTTKTESHLLLIFPLRRMLHFTFTFPFHLLLLKRQPVVWWVGNLGFAS